MNANSQINSHCTTAAIATVVTIAEILKNNGLAVEKSEASIYFYIFLQSNYHYSIYIFLNINAEIMTSTVDIKDDSRGRPVQKAKVFEVLFLLKCVLNLILKYVQLRSVKKNDRMFMLMKRWSFAWRDPFAIIVALLDWSDS